jgi:hypothetical protein
MTFAVAVRGISMRWMLAVAWLVVSAGSAMAECPAGAYAWVDRRGVEVCKRDIVGPTVGSEVCSEGTRAATDRRGARTCKNLRSAERPNSHARRDTRP